jgi:hypothetical protein
MLISERQRQEQDPLIVHVHMPKAGGTTLDHLLQAIYGDRLLIAHPLRGWPQEWPPEFKAMVAEKRDYYRAFSGHSAYGIHELFQREALYISSVRDPIDRFESYYNFCRHWVIHHHHEVAKQSSIGEFFRYLLQRDDIELFNLQCLLLCGEKNFEAAKDFVVKRYFAIVPMRFFEPSIRLLERRLGWQRVDIPRLNVTKHWQTVGELSPQELKILKEGNAEDAKIVTFCEANINHWYNAV